ncbi:cobalamin biosynthesis protein CobD [Sulfoacidibacillus thermotolerans]|uniref:Cobalamin biosynthesis protein CobD n=2 Tax=Sulfoacidibacillus thermotolerans TaxID=1765684 RepID=A0A2U3D9N9_SULT2|nr:cobalamin biosynthesis protein CobD [Sulfoacidibacillus thermotolerans]
MHTLISSHFLMALCGLLFDVIIGDPQFLTHPVVLIARFAYILEQWLYIDSPYKNIKVWRGGLLTGIVLFSTYSLTAILILAVNHFSPWLGDILNIWLISTTIAAKGLDQAGKRVLRPLQQGNLIEARKYTGYIVSRETEHLDEPDLVRATVETIAENLVDAVIAPLFFAIIGGAPLALTYRAANTLDSLFGYKNDRYIDFGLIPARTDDVLNYIPARLSLFLFAILGPFFHTNPARIIHVVRRDAKKHPSPNSGIPESACATLLGVRLGGENRYHGTIHFRAYLGDSILPLSQFTILRAIRILWGIVIVLTFICLIGIIF